MAADRHRDYLTQDRIQGLGPPNAGHTNAGSVERANEPLTAGTMSFRRSAIPKWQWCRAAQPPSLYPDATQSVNSGERIEGGPGSDL